MWFCLLSRAWIEVERNLRDKSKKASQHAGGHTLVYHDARYIVGKERLDNDFVFKSSPKACLFSFPFAVNINIGIGIYLRINLIIRIFTIAFVNISSHHRRFPGYERQDAILLVATCSHCMPDAAYRQCHPNGLCQRRQVPHKGATHEFHKS